MKIIIKDENAYAEYYEVPKKVAKAIKTILDECANVETEIVSAEGEFIDGNKNIVS